MLGDRNSMSPTAASSRCVATRLSSRDRREACWRRRRPDRAPARIGPGRHRHLRAVTLDDVDGVEFRAEIVRDDLRRRGLQALTVRSHAESRGDRARGSRCGLRSLGTGVDRHARRDRDARSDSGQLGLTCNADADITALGSGHLPQLHVALHSRRL